MPGMEIPELQLEVLQGLFERFVTPDNLILMKMFGEKDAESDTIEWESKIGSRGLTPFVAPGAQAPRVGMTGVASNSVHAAYWKEKIWLDEVLLNNLRQPGTREQHQSAQQKVSDETQNLKNRCERRKEWMFAKMLTNGVVSYKGKGGVNIALDYSIPAEHQVTLAADRLWSTGANKNIVEDIMDASITMSNANGASLVNGLFAAEVLKLMVLDSGIQNLLQKSAFGNGDLYARPTEVLGALLNIPNMILYNEQYQIRAFLTGNVTANSTTVVYVDDTLDFEVGGTLRFWNAITRAYEDETIASIDHDSGTITVSAAPSKSFIAGRDFVAMTKKYIPTDKFVLFADSVEGYPIAEFIRAPFGLGRNFGSYVDQKEEWDPDGMYVRVQNKGLPVLYQEDAVYILTVK